MNLYTVRVSSYFEASMSSFLTFVESLDGTFIGDQPNGAGISDCEKNRQRGSSACGPPQPQPDPSPNAPDPAKKDELLSITCSCHFGYFMPDGSWVSGVDVRAGRAPPRPGMVVPEPMEEII